MKCCLAQNIDALFDSLLQVLESCVKNCGHGLHEEIATYRFMEDMKDLIKVSHIILCYYPDD